MGIKLNLPSRSTMPVSCALTPIENSEAGIPMGCKISWCRNSSTLRPSVCSRMAFR